ncbi:subtilisin-like protease SBT4.3 [Tanacetum coccineum]
MVSIFRKIIGARYYSIDDLSSISARDRTGHGTHVASIVAGNYVKGASFYGIADGVAKGGVPSARLAVYKVCDIVCHTTDLLSAFDDAIADGVDVLSVSISLDQELDFTIDPIAIGSLHAVRRNILTSVSAGNEGPVLGSIQNSAPWMLTAGASDIDRRIMAKVLLGNGAILVGQGVNAFPSSYRESPLVRGKEVTSTCSETDARNCLPQCLESSLVEQKVVLCDMDPSFQAINITGVLGFIIPIYKKQNASVVLPYTVVELSENDLNLVRIYHSYNTDPKVQILKSEAVHNSDARLVATFSSRGPSKFVPNIIKPDVTAPGVEILAAFSPKAAPSGYPIDNRSVEYNILSGTSMACPHVTAAAAYVKSFHPSWSPSAIKSALMTTAWKFFDGLHPEAEFAYGSGHINALMATDPGLVYETRVEEYQSLTATNASFPSDREINYPSMAALVDMQSFVVSIPRTVRNVGLANSTYVAVIDGELSDLRISVEPSTLQFTALNENLNFVVTVRGKRMKPLTTRRASLVWTDGVHKVHSPLVLYRLNATSGGEKAIPSSVPVLIIITLLLFLRNREMSSIALKDRRMVRNFLDVPELNDVCWSWKKILQTRNLLRDHIVHRLGDGTLTFVWFDNWVADVVENGEWECPSICFSVKGVWNVLSEVRNVVPWYKVVWFNQRLKTQDRISKWQDIGDAKCALFLHKLKKTVSLTVGKDPTIRLRLEMAIVGPLSGKDPLIIVVADTDCLPHKGLDMFCHKFHIPDDVHPQLPSPNQTIHEMPTRKISVYTRFFEYANFQLPLSTFLVNVLRHYRINLSQLSVIAAAKVSHFEILCRVYNIEPTVGLFRCFYVNSKNKRWMSFSKRPDSDVVCYTKPLDPLKHWNDHNFWVDSFACPASFPWHTDKNVSRDPFPKSSEFNADHYAILVAHLTPFWKFPEPFFCLIGMSRYYTLDVLSLYGSGSRLDTAYLRVGYGVLGIS